ncbi:MAG: hypothetical protein QNL01_12220 [Akkermansiaceae bacterium]
MMKVIWRLIVVGLAIAVAACKSKTTNPNDETSVASEWREDAEVQQIGDTTGTREKIDISDSDNLDSYVGRFVVVRGVVTQTKCPYIHGIDMWDLHNLRGKLVEATGILESWTVTEEDVERSRKNMIAHRGPGTFYRLKNMKYKQVAEQE